MYRLQDIIKTVLKRSDVLSVRCRCEFIHLRLIFVEDIPLWYRIKNNNKFTCLQSVFLFVFVNFLRVPTIILYLLSSSLFILSFMDFSVGYHAFPHSYALN